MSLFAANDVDVAYGDLDILRKVSISVDAGQVVGIFGPNGAGKTTLLRTISGLKKPKGGTIEFDGKRIEGSPAHEVVRRGISQVPEGRGVIPDFTVLENLKLGLYARSGSTGAELDEVFQLFPVLGERRKQLAGMLSGGEQQMLAIGRSLLSRPKMLIVDELSLGLAPKIAGELIRLLTKIAAGGRAILLVEQNVRLALKVVDKVYLLVNGSVVFSGTPGELKEHGDIMRKYLGHD
jgi:branched-chain amino acid transport system ATP-binding protein